METALTEIEKPAYQLIKPQDITKFSKVLAEFIAQSKLSTVIRNEKYVNVDGWKFAGLNFGLVPIVSEPNAKHSKGDVMTILYHEVDRRSQRGLQKVIEPFFASSNSELADRYRHKFADKIKKEITTDYFNYSCGCEIINTVTGMKVGSGFGVCSNLELAKSSFDEFAVNSMAQTRSIGRAFKNVIGFVMKAAGYSPTPLEEMDGQNKGVIIDEGVLIDIKSALEGCNTVDEVVRLWNEIGSQAQSSGKVKAQFTKRKMEIQNAANK